MKKISSLLGAVFLLGLSLRAQETVVAPAAEPLVTEPAVLGGSRLDQTQIEQLLGPIALYPDALIALILPASTFSSDIVLAARYLRAGGDSAQVDEQPWDDSVRALAHYSEVVKWMDENLSWTKQLGEAFVAQPTDVMNVVQRFRLKARAVGSLVDTPQQNVVVDNSVITIVPAQPDVIYVPSYDPEIVYVSRPTYYTQPFFSFGPAYATGLWLSYNVDWRRHRVWCVDRPHRETHWREHRSHWHRPSSYRPDFASRPDYYRPWTPPHSFRPSRGTVHSRGHTTIARPRYHDGRLTSGAGERRWDRNYTRPARATGERFPPPAPGPALPSSAASTIPQLPLANPLPHALPSSLPESPQPATPSNQPRNNGSRSRGDRGERDHRVDHDRRIDHGRSLRNNRATVQAPSSPVSRSSAQPAPVGATPGRPGFQSRRSAPPTPTFSQPAAPIRTAVPAPTPVTSSPSTQAAPEVNQPSPARGTNRSFDLPRDSHRRNPGVSGGRGHRGGDPER